LQGTVAFDIPVKTNAWGKQDLGTRQVTRIQVFAMRKGQLGDQGVFHEHFRISPQVKAQPGCHTEVIADRDFILSVYRVLAELKGRECLLVVW